jgi:PAS domain S-box-containing protein
MLLSNNAELNGLDIIKIMESSFDGIIICDSNGKTMFVNSAAERIMDTSAKEIIGKSSWELQQSGIISHATSMQAIKTGKPFTSLQKYKNGKSALVTSSLIGLDSMKQLVFINVRDVSAINEVSWSDQDIIEEDTVLSHSREYKKILEIAKTVAPKDATVLLLGETGVGKDVLAHLIHQHSIRQFAPIVKVNCGAFPENLLESELFGYSGGAFTGADSKGKKGVVFAAEGGTLFLDEIGELPLVLQPKLLELLQDFSYNPVGSIKKLSADIRIIAATNQDLKQLVEEKKFRSDLYYRLNVIPMEIPPLRNRIEDIIPLANIFLSKYNHKYNQNKDFNSEIYPPLIEYHWPGNIRELSNIIERLVITSPDNEIGLSNLPEVIKLTRTCIETSEVPSLKVAVEKFEEMLLKELVEKGLTTYEIAEQLNISQSTASRRIKKYSIKD